VSDHESNIKGFTFSHARNVNTGEWRVGLTIKEEEEDTILLLSREDAAALAEDLAKCTAELPADGTPPTPSMETI
jgi:hypothetical protein